MVSNGELRVEPDSLREETKRLREGRDVGSSGGENGSAASSRPPLEFRAELDELRREVLRIERFLEGNANGGFEELPPPSYQMH
jgi:hypothetical protein